MDRNASWVIDGNYRKLEYERRLQEADRIIFMDFNPVFLPFQGIPEISGP